MDIKEATEWVKGERSTINLYMQTCSENENANLITAQADAAMAQQAYWLLRAHKEGLLDSKSNEDKQIASMSLLREWIRKYGKSNRPGAWEYDKEAVKLIEDSASLVGIEDPFGFDRSSIDHRG